MGHVADWNRQNMGKNAVKKMADGGEVQIAGIDDQPSEAPFSVTAGGTSFNQGMASGVGGGGRIGFRKNLDKDSDIELGISGEYSKVKAGEFKKEQARISGADLTYRNKNDSYSVSYNEGPKPNGKRDSTIMFNYRKDI